MIYFSYETRRPPRINFRATDIVIYYDFRKPAQLILMTIVDTNTNKVFTDDTNTVIVAYLINKDI